MNAKQVQKFVLSYLQATDSHIAEKTPAYVTVKLSPVADRALTNRPYYWSFVDRTGAEPETMTFRWNFEPPQEAVAVPQVNMSMMIGGTRVIQEDVYFGSKRLGQIFDSVSQFGKCVMLFEDPPKTAASPLGSQPYTAWLGVNFKVGYECDMKREELYGMGISLATGVIDERFLARLRDKRLTPRLPANVHLLRNGLSLRKAMTQLEHALERKLRGSDYGWAEEAEERRKDEQGRVEQYYRPMIERAATPEQSEALQARFRQRREEIDWQYRPRVTMSVMNCGLFHLPGID